MSDAADEPAALEEGTLDIAEQRERLAQALIADTQAICAGGDINREALAAISERLVTLAARRELWSHDDYPDPPAGELQHRYRVAAAADDSITLYMNVLRPGKKSQPHNHTTWACVAAVEGIEHNILYERTDDQTIEGRAELREVETIPLAPGGSVTLMPDDIHHIEVRGDDVIRHLHFYGRPLETLSTRKAFDREAGTYEVMDIGVKTIG
ncbi:MAG: cysteine dioxygenase family protein [Pseudomonadota bacterium]